MTTTQGAGNVFKKITDDLNDCFNETKTGLNNSDISEIIYLLPYFLFQTKCNSPRRYCIYFGNLLI